MDTLLSFITDPFKQLITECVIQPLKRHLAYPFTYKTNIQTLSNQVENLRTQREDLLPFVDQAERRGDELKSSVRKWLTDSEVAIQKAEIVIAEEDQARQKCCYSLVPNWKRRYQLSRKAEAAEASVVQKLQTAVNFREIAYHPNLEQVLAPSVCGNEELATRSSIQKQVMDALADPNVNVVGVSGMGGVGKTTLAEHVERQATQAKSFDLVFMATVSPTPDLDRIRQQLADMLDLKFKEETSETKARRLHQTLMGKKKILIILDDIWKEFPLKEVGIPIGNYHTGCKLFLTSRSVDVLSSMEARPSFGIDTLSGDEAWSLFLRTVGEIKNVEMSIATQVAQKCAGLPLLIVTVAKTLRNKGPPKWRDVLWQLSEVDASHSIAQGVYIKLELSYDFLPDNGIKPFFLLCGQLGQSHIYTEDLLKYCISLDLLKNLDTFEKCRDRVLAWIGDLKDSNLLMDSNLDGFVKIHDLIRDTALSIASRNQCVLAVKSTDLALKEWPKEDELKNCTRVCFPFCDFEDLAERFGSQKAEFLMLGFDRHFLKIPDPFFDGITELKALHFSKIIFSCLPRSLGSLSSLSTLYFNQCVLKDIAIIGKLKNLKILSFASSSIQHLPKELGELSQLKLLDLSKCMDLNFIAYGVMSSLSKLEELYMLDSFTNWDKVDMFNSDKNASLTELEGLSHLTALELRIPEAVTIPKALFSEKLVKYKITIGNAHNWFYNSSTMSRVLGLPLTKSIYTEPWVKMMMKKTEALHLNVADRIENLPFDQGDEMFPQLKYLHLKNGNLIRYIVNSRMHFPCKAFSILKFLDVRSMPGLEQICHGRLAEGSFTDLTEVRISKCKNLKNLFSLSVVRGISRLQILEVEDCDSLEEIIIDESYCSDVESGNMVTFSHLRELTLSGLPSFRNFCGVVGMVTNAGSQEIEAERDVATSLPLFNEMICHGRLAEGSFADLTELRIYRCKNLKNLFSLSVVRGISRLQILIVQYCDSLEEIIIDESHCSDVESGNMVTFSHLHKLKLRHLPSFRSFCGAVGMVTDAGSQEIEAEHDVATSLPLFNQMVAFPVLEELRLQCVGNKKKMWHNQLPRDSFGKLKFLWISDFKELETVFPFDVVGRFPMLEELSMEECHSVQHIYQPQKEIIVEGTPVFPSLKTLKLQRMRSFSNFSPRNGNFQCPCLKEITIRGCPSYGKVDISRNVQGNTPFFNYKKDFPCLDVLSLDDKATKLLMRFQLPKDFLQQIKFLELLFTANSAVSLSTILQRFSNLETLHLEGLTLKEEPYQHVQVGIDMKDAIVPRHGMKELGLHSISNLKHIWTQDFGLNPLLAFENLQIISVSFCHDLISLSMPSTSPTFQNLTTLEVKYCERLINLITLSIAKSMTQLAKMIVDNCDQLMEIVATEQSETIDEIVFEKLNSLELRFLPKLSSFSSSSCSFIFPSLEQVIVIGCPSMKVFSQGDLSTPKLRRVIFSRYSLDNWRWERNLNDTIEQMFLEMVGAINNWRVSEFPPSTTEHLRQFPFALRELEVYKCGSHSNAIPFYVLRRLGNLISLTVSECDLVEQVFDLEELIVDEGPVGLMSNLVKLCLKDLPRLRHVWDLDTQQLLGFKNLNCLQIHNCNSLTTVLTSSMALNLAKLTSIEVKGCILLEQIITNEDVEEAKSDETIFPSLISITLENLPRLTSFNSSSVLCSPSLKEICVVNCPGLKLFGSTFPSMPIEEDKEKLLQVAISSVEKLCVDWHKLKEIWDENFGAEFFGRLKTIELTMTCFPDESPHFPSDFLLRLPNLEGMVLSDDNSLEEIFLHEMSVSEERFLKSLKLRKLQNLKHLAEEDSPTISAFQSLEKLEIKECHSMKMAVPSSVSFQNLKDLSVSICSGLIKLIASSAATNLGQLTKMYIYDCESLQEIVASDGDGVVESEIVFKQLKCLELNNLPSLTSFCSSNFAFHFPSLEEVIVENCPKMQLFARGMISTPKLLGIKTSFFGEVWPGNINSIIQEMFTERYTESNDEI